MILRALSHYRNLMKGNKWLLLEVPESFRGCQQCCRHNKHNSNSYFTFATLSTRTIDRKSRFWERRPERNKKISVSGSNTDAIHSHRAEKYIEDLNKIKNYNRVCGVNQKKNCFLMIFDSFGSRGPDIPFGI